MNGGYEYIEMIFIVYRTIVAIAGKDYVVLGGDTRLTQGYEISKSKCFSSTWIDTEVCIGKWWLLDWYGNFESSFGFRHKGVTIDNEIDILDTSILIVKRWVVLLLLLY